MTRASSIALLGAVAGLASVLGGSCGSNNPLGITTAGASGATGGTGQSGGASGSAGVGGDVTKVLPSAGCGLEPPAALIPGTLVRQMIATAGTKDADCADSKCGAWTDNREYWVKLPAGYDRTKAYPMFFEGSGCGVQGNDPYRIPIFDSTVIRVGMTPSAYWQAFHATNPDQGCFDDKEGDDSVDWPFYEAVYDLLASTTCFDRNRVFSGGYSSGAWFSNELGCKYVGDPTRAVRGIMPVIGGLPSDPRYVPTCTTKPMAGMWIYDVDDDVNPFGGSKLAIARAMKVDGCTIGTGYDDAELDNFTISPADMVSCKKIRGCPDLYPLVVCALPGATGRFTAFQGVVDPGWPTFINLFSSPPLLGP